MPGRVILVVALATALATPAAATRLAGDAAALRVEGLAATTDGGWLVVGTLAGTPGRGDGLVLRADAADAAAWAVRTPGVVLQAVAALPDGGAIVAGSTGLVARLDGSGNLAWQAAVGSGDVEMRALSCDGWQCVAAGASIDVAVLVRVDASTGQLVAEWDAAATATRTTPTAVLQLPDGDVLIGCTLEASSMARATVARLDGSGSSRWAWEVSPPEWMWSPDFVADNAVRALAAWPDGRTLVLAETPRVEPLGLALAADGVPDAALSSSTSSLGRPRSAVVLPGGDVILAGSGAVLSRHDASLACLDAVIVGERPDWSGLGYAARTAGGEILLVAGSRVARLPIDLAEAGGCASVAKAALPFRGGGGVPGVPADVIDFPLRDVLGWNASSVTFVAACTSGACLADCETSCTNGLDDDASGRADCDDAACSGDPACALADPDADGVPNVDDCRPADGATSSPPPPLRTLRLTAWKGARLLVLVRWSDADTIHLREPTADVLRGSLTRLHLRRSASDGACIVHRANGNAWYDAGAEARGNFWYLVRPWNACGAGTWDEAGLDSGTGGCP